MILRYGERYEISNDLMNEIAGYMDDEICEDLHFKMSSANPTPEDNERFLKAYCQEDAEFEGLLYSEFRIEFG